MAGRFATSITSIKSIDVTAKTYQEGNRLYVTVKRYVEALAAFKEEPYKKDQIRTNSETKRILELVLPPVKLTKSQREQLARIQREAAKQGVEIQIRIYPEP